MIARLLLSVFFGLSAGSVSADGAGPSCAYLAADGMRQNANLLLFLVDAHLARTSTSLEIPDAIKELPVDADYETQGAAGSTEHWIYIAPPTDADKRVGPVPTDVPTLHLQFDENDRLSQLEQRKAPCPDATPEPTEAETLAILAQQQRLEAAVVIAQSCDCITKNNITLLVNWPEVEELDLPRSTLNLFQPYIAFGPEIQHPTENEFSVIPVPRNVDALGHVPVEELSEGLTLRLNSADFTQLIRVIPYNER